MERIQEKTRTLKKTRQSCGERERSFAACSDRRVSVPTCVWHPNPHSERCAKSQSPNICFLLTVHLFSNRFSRHFSKPPAHFSHSLILQMRLLWCSTNSPPASPPRNPMFSKLHFFCLNCWGIFSFGTNPKWESWLRDLPLVLAGCTSGRDGYRVTNSASWDLAGPLVEKSLVIDQAWRNPQTLSQPRIKKEQHAQTIMINHEVWDSPFQGFKVVHYIHVFMYSTGNIVGRSIEVP